MSSSQPVLHLVCYDIRNPKRLIRVHRFLRNHGFPLQYSVFTVPLTPRQAEWLTGELDELINPKRDDVRLYPLPAQPDRISFGRQTFPDGVMLLSPGGDLLRPGGRRAGSRARRRLG